LFVVERGSRVPATQRRKCDECAARANLFEKYTAPCRRREYPTREYYRRCRIKTTLSAFLLWEWETGIIIRAYKNGAQTVRRFVCRYCLILPFPQCSK